MIERFHKQADILRFLISIVAPGLAKAMSPKVFNVQLLSRILKYTPYLLIRNHCILVLARKEEIIILEFVLGDIRLQDFPDFIVSDTFEGICRFLKTTFFT